MEVETAATEPPTVEEAAAQVQVEEALPAPRE